LFRCIILGVYFINMDFSITILGASSALPTANRFPSAQVVKHNESIFLIDCGEGTQMQLRRNKISLLKINHIFISHLHGDHYYGIFGLLTSMNLLGRKKELHLYAPPELRRILNYIWKQTGIQLLYEVVFHVHNYSGFNLIADCKHMQVFSFPLSHSKQNCGFKFCEKQSVANIRKDCIERFELGIVDVRRIKAGAGIYLIDGTYIDNKELTHHAPEPRTYTYCSDTVFVESLNTVIGNTDLLYHEATFAGEANDLAIATGHSTSIQAAHVAKQLSAKALILGHFSTRYTDVGFLQQEAETIFKPVFLAEDNAEFAINRITRATVQVK